MVHDRGSILPDVQFGKILSPASFLLLQNWKESLSWTDPCGLFHWAQAGITDSVLLLPLAMPSYLIHRLLLSWQQRQLGDTGSIIVTLVSTQQTHTHGRDWIHKGLYYSVQPKWVYSYSAACPHSTSVETEPVRNKEVIVPICIAYSPTSKKVWTLCKV